MKDDVVDRAIERIKELENRTKSTTANPENVSNKSSKKDVLRDKFLLRRLGNGNLAKGKKIFNQLLKRKFYWTYELNEHEIKALLTCGYVKSNPRKKGLIVRDEHGYFDYIICDLNENESMQHLRDKEFIASLNRNISKVEWIVPGTQKRIDVMLKLDKEKIGIEIQHSSLEYSRLKEKIDLLDSRFNRWFFIVPKKFIKKYSYLDTSKGKVTTMKEALNEIKEILSKKSRNLKKAK